jgi:post-segregation antitoxin (ccd killing protein)
LLRDYKLVSAAAEETLDRRETANERTVDWLRENVYNTLVKRSQFQARKRRKYAQR